MPTAVPLSQVRDLLGHASIVTTERYDKEVGVSDGDRARSREAGGERGVPERRHEVQFADGELG